MKRIASVTEKMVPIMAALYIVGSLVVIIANIKNIPNVFYQIFVGAFNPTAVLGGAAGITVKAAMRFGVARGLFSNEAGMGSTPHAHAVAKVDKPEEQGIVAMIGVFLDTFVVLTLTALVILSTNSLGSGAEGVALAQFGILQGIWQLWRRVHCHMPAVLRLLHHYWLVFLRRAEHQVPLRSESCEDLRLVSGDIRHHRFHFEGGSSMEPVRPVQRHHGIPQLVGFAGPVRTGSRHQQGQGQIKKLGMAV